MKKRTSILVVSCLLGLLACGGSTSDPPGASQAGAGDAGAAGVASGGSGGAAAGSAGAAGAGAGGAGAAGSAGAGGAVDKAAGCAASFGQKIGSLGFSRFDGTVVAVVKPGNESCAMPNGTHVIVQIEMQGEVYRMVVNVKSTKGTESRIFTAETHAPLVGEAWADGWHKASLDYTADLGLHSDGFTPQELAPASSWIEDALTIGARVSVFGTADSKPESAHLVHRNGSQHDGAIVVDPTGDSPRWLLFRFDEQSF